MALGLTQISSQCVLGPNAGQYSGHTFCIAGQGDANGNLTVSAKGFAYEQRISPGTKADLHTWSDDRRNAIGSFDGHDVRAVGVFVYFYSGDPLTFQGAAAQGYPIGGRITVNGSNKDSVFTLTSRGAALMVFNEDMPVLSASASDITVSGDGDYSLGILI